MERQTLLASASPRRRRLLAMLGVEYECLSVDVPEDPPAAGQDPVAYAEGLAQDKAQAAMEARGSETLIVTADTIVVHDGRILGKPVDLDEARAMLRGLSGGSHEVVTAVTLTTSEAESSTFSVTSDVLMKELDSQAIGSWVDAGELLGCAGAYNIEGHLATVADTECYQNVAGLPLCHLWRALAELPDPPDGLQPPVSECDTALGRKCLLGRELGAL